MEQFLNFFRELFSYNPDEVSYTENHPTLSPEEDLKQDIVANTFLQEDDGTSFGYSYLDTNTQNSYTPSYFQYRMKNGKASDLQKLSPEDQRTKIYSMSDDSVSVNEIEEQNYLANLMRTMHNINRTTDVLKAPKGTSINEIDPSKYEDTRILGVTNPDLKQIAIRNPYISNAPLEAQPYSSGVDSGWWTTANPTLHELGHMSDPNFEIALRERFQQQLEEISEKNRGKYSIGDIIGNLLYNAGVPMRQAIKNAFGVNLGGTAFRDLSVSPDLEYERSSAAAEAYTKQLEDFSEDIMVAWRNAVQKAGFENTNQALESISEYGGSSPDEGFAEAYADVVQNGENAKPFSKALFLEMEKVARKYLPSSTTSELAEKQLAVKSLGSQGDLDLDRLLQIKTSFR